MATRRGEDALTEDARAALCSSPLKLVVMTGDELVAMQETVNPVYERLAEDERAQAHLEGILALKDAVGAQPDVFSCDADAS